MKKYQNLIKLAQHLLDAKSGGYIYPDKRSMIKKEEAAELGQLILEVIKMVNSNRKARENAA